MWELYKHNLCFAILFGIALFSRSQDTLKFHSFGFGAVFIRSYESMVSPMPYQGITLLQNYRYEKISNKKIKSFNINLLPGISRNQNLFYLLHLVNNINYTYLKRIFEPEISAKLYAGISLSSNINTRYHFNFSAPYGEHFVSLSPVFHYEKIENFIHKTWHFYNRTQIGILHSVIRPGYGYSPPEPFTAQEPSTAKALFQSYQTFPVWKFFFFSNEFCLIKNYENGNRKSISYLFSLTATGIPEKSVQAYHGIKICYQWLKK